MDSLKEGYSRFRASGWPEQRALFEQLAAKGQRPKALIVACVDSRVDPSRIFDSGPGELLIVRNVANLVPPYAPDAAYHGTSAALEFGVRVLEISDVVVLGHGMCGGVQTLLRNDLKNVYDFISPWMSIAEKAKDRVLACYDPAQHQQACEHEVIKLSLKNLMSYPWIKTRVEQGKLKLHGSWFSIASGELRFLDPSGEFKFMEVMP